MPLGGADGIGWDETNPPDTEQVSFGDDRIRSVKTSIRQGLDSEHNWPSSGGNDVGYHRFGSARAFFNTQSLVSSADTDGRLMITSDTSRLFGVGSEGTVLFGGATAILQGGFAGALPQRHYWAIEAGTVTTDGSGDATITFPNSGFNLAPILSLTPDATGAPPSNTIVTFFSRTPTSVAIKTVDGANANVGSVTVHYLSIGSRTL